jgi:hypothetical protein
MYLTRNRRPMIHVRGTEYQTAGAAIRCRGDGKAILLGGKNLVVAEAEADRLAGAGVEFAYLCEYVMPDGEVRIMTVPVN